MVAPSTFLFEIPLGRDRDVERVLKALDWRPKCAHQVEQVSASLGDSFRSLDDFVHFMSMVVVPCDAKDIDQRSWLLIEVCADTGQGDLPSRLVEAIPDELRTVLEAVEQMPRYARPSVVAQTPGQQPQDADAMVRALRRSAKNMGTSLFAQPGFIFNGTPEMTVRRIRAEAALAAWVRGVMRGEGGEVLPGGSALRKLDFVRRKVFERADLKWGLRSEPVPLLGGPTAALAVGPIVKLTAAAIRDYLWILLPLPLVLLLMEHFIIKRDWLGALGRGFFLLLLEFVLIGAAAAYTYRRLRREEDADDPLDVAPNPKAIERLMALENYRGVVQNHLAGDSRLKLGWVRAWTLRLALWVVAEKIQMTSQPGFLNRIGTIHFARWYLLPTTRRLIFLSNYDGSWESYLEDFIARLRQGLSSLWSNTENFPRTTNLTTGGAADGARFKRWARCQQLPTQAWYTAYPQLTTASIRTNAAIRYGLAGASTEQAAVEWLSRLGYAWPDELESPAVPTLVFGGLSKLRYAHGVAVRFHDTATARNWLLQHHEKVTYGAYSKSEPALVLGFSVSGLEKLMPSEALERFPVAFQEGMAHPPRARLLGDYEGDPKSWGMRENPVDMFCAVYAYTDSQLADFLRDLKSSFIDGQHVVVYERAMRELPETGKPVDVFGFQDGISQPIVRGTKDWTASKNARHLVSPGEFVLGYRDNLGQIAPTPVFDNVDYGRNGTFLVVRHFELDRPEFDRFVARQAQQLDERDKVESSPELYESSLSYIADSVRQYPTAQRALVEPPAARAASPPDVHSKERYPVVSHQEEWVAAKLVGRWRDGTPLVRWPSEPSGQPDNDFAFGQEDPDGIRCPLGAHIRRANPRDSFEPGSQIQVDIVNRHRILRVGRRVDARDNEKAGMLFMCLNGDIERQFEFLQQTWLLSPSFHGLDQEVDPLLSPGGKNQSFTVPDLGGTLRFEPMSRFSKVVGGGYFFLPGKACLQSLAGVQPAPLSVAPVHS